MKKIKKGCVILFKESQEPWSKHTRHKKGKNPSLFRCKHRGIKPTGGIKI